METPLAKLALDPMEVDRLFQRDPVSLSNEEMDMIVEAERRARSEFVSDERAGKKASPKRKPKKSAGELAGKTLSDLGLDLTDIEI